MPEGWEVFYFGSIPKELPVSSFPTRKGKAMPFREEMFNAQGLVGLGVDITNRCNRRCATCFAHHNGRDMKPDLWQRIVDEGRRLEFPELYVLGGEPGIIKDLSTMLRLAMPNFKMVLLVTNADFLADENVCREIADIGVGVAAQRHTLGSDSQAREMEKLLSGGDHLDMSNAGWENIEKCFPSEKVSVQCCITRPVVKSGSIFEVFRWLRCKGYEPVMEFTKEGGEFKRGCALDISPDEMMEVLKKFQAIDRTEFGRNGSELLLPQAYGRTCHMQETSLHIQVDGNVIPCVGFPNLSYGNIAHESLDQILAHPLRHLIKNPQDWIYGYCRDECPHFQACTGGCRGSTFDIAGCYRASFYYCPHIPRDRLKLTDMIPPTCKGCSLEGHPSCKPKRG